MKIAEAKMATSTKAGLQEVLDQAATAFAASGHSFGSQILEHFRLSHKLQDSANQIQDFLAIMNHYCQSNYPIGFIQASSTPMMLAFNSGNFRLYTLIQEILHSVCNSTGILHERLLLEVKLLAALNAGTGRYARVMELGHRVYFEALERQYWNPAYFAGQVVSLAYLQAGDYDSAYQYAVEISNMCKEENLKLQSQSIFNLVLMQASRPSTTPNEHISAYKAAAEQLLTAANEDLLLEEYSLACQKLSYVSQLQFDLARKDHANASRWRSDVERSIEAIREAAQHLEEDAKLESLTNCEDMVVTQLLESGKSKSTDDDELEAIGICDGMINSFQSHPQRFRLGMKHLFRSLCYLQRYQKQRHVQHRLPHLIASEKDCIEAVKIFTEVQSAQQVLVARHALTRIHVECWEFHGADANHIFQSLEAFDTAANILRKELSALGGLPALLQKQKFASGKEVADAYSWAAGISLRENRHKDLWIWSQRRKARSLSDMLGLGVLVPESVRKSISATEGAQELFDQLNVLMRSMTTAPDNERGFIRQHIEDVEEQLKVSPAFKDFLALRDGNNQNISQLEGLKEKDAMLAPARKVVWVDFVIHRDNIQMLVVDCENVADFCACIVLPLSVATIRSWMSQYFATDSIRRDWLKKDYVAEDTSPLRALDPLIAPLADKSGEGDLLVFSGTGILSSLPLHALKIDNDGFRGPRSLIERNPVVYAPSLSVMTVCMTRSQNNRLLKRPVFLSNFDSIEEAKKIRHQLHGVARSWDSRCACNEDLTLATFAKLTADASLIHYHGHCIFNAGNVLKQALVLAKSGEYGVKTQAEKLTGSSQVTSDPSNLGDLRQAQEMANEDRLLQSPEDDSGTHMTVEDMFKLQLDSPLVVLVACESASQSISAGDEPLGLIAGLLCAGASSVVGASWPIPSSAGRAFTDAFYKHISKYESRGFVDVAVALQEAVLDMMDDKLDSSTYYWGAFCLNGSWIHRS